MSKHLLSTKVSHYVLLVQHTIYSFLPRLCLISYKNTKETRPEISESTLRLLTSTSSFLLNVHYAKPVTGRIFAIPPSASPSFHDQLTLHNGMDTLKIKLPSCHSQHGLTVLAMSICPSRCQCVTVSHKTCPQAAPTYLSSLQPHSLTVSLRDCRDIMQNRWHTSSTSHRCWSRFMSFGLRQVSTGK
jgi:hypothetical protein